MARRTCEIYRYDPDKGGAPRKHVFDVNLARSFDEAAGGAPDLFSSRKTVCPQWVFKLNGNAPGLSA